MSGEMAGYLLRFPFKWGVKIVYRQYRHTETEDEAKVAQC